MSSCFGPVVLFGSGEISSMAQPIYDQVLRPYAPPVRISVLETPAGFQLNSAEVAGDVAEYLRVHLQNYRPQVSVIPARKRGTLFSPDRADLLAPMFTSQMLFLGPGSPTYAVHQLEGSLAWQVVLARHRQGYALVFASAATIAASAWALPVYEIYKVGEDVHWKKGLDLWAAFGLSLVFVPHWNNNEGGEKHDTSRCFMGRTRFEEMLRLLPPGQTVIGIDEHTALILEPEAGACKVMGAGGVTLLKGDGEQRFASGETFPCHALGNFACPDALDGISTRVWDMIAAAEKAEKAASAPSAEVLTLLEQRQAARTARDWAASDRLRDEIARLGWEVRDTREGQELSPLV
jgi:hypothetical protein